MTNQEYLRKMMSLQDDIKSFLAITAEREGVALAAVAADFIKELTHELSIHMSELGDGYHSKFISVMEERND